MGFSGPIKVTLEADPLLGRLEKDARAALLDRSITQRFRAGEAVYHLGDPAGGIYLVLEGGMRVEIATGNLNTFLAHYLPPGIWFGEPSALTGQPRMVGVMAAQDSELLHVNLTNLNQLIAQYPDILRHLAGITQFHLRTAIGAIADLMIRDTEPRFIATLMRLAGIRDGALRGTRYDVFFTQEEIASMANVARTTANAMLRTLENEGLIEITYRRVVIIDEPRLRKRLENLS